MAADHPIRPTTIFPNEDKYQLVFSACNLGGWEYNCNTKELFCSPEYFAMLGYGDPLQTEWEVFSLADAWENIYIPMI